MMTKIPPDCVSTFKHLQEWLEEAEGFAKSIKRDGARENLAFVILECVGAIRIRATLNNDKAAGCWRDDRVSALMDMCAARRSEAEELAALNQRNKASRDGVAKRKEKAAEEFDRAGFLTEGAVLKKKNPKLSMSNIAIATRLAKKYKRAPGYLAKLLPKKK